MEQLRMPRRRRRAAQSCLMCRQRKIKCDRNNPCAPCVAAKHRCLFKVYSDSLSSDTIAPTSHTPGPGDRSPQASPTSASNHLPTPQTTLESRTTRDAFSSSSRRQPAFINPTEPILADVLERLQRLEALASTPSTEPAHGLSSRPQSSDPKGTQLIMRKARIMRFPMGISPEFNPIIACFSAITGSGASFMSAKHGERGCNFQEPETLALVQQAREKFQSCKSLMRNIKSQQFNLPFDQTDLLLPTQSDADVFKAQYFAAFEPVYRILHKNTFDLESQHFWADNMSATTSLRLKNLLVVALGSSVCELAHGQDVRKTAYQWVQYAQAWLAGPLKKDQLSLSGIQVYCLTILARKVFSIGEDLLWGSVGELMHRAMQIGLHRDPDYLPPMSVLDAEMRRRLWATILELTVQSALDSGMPPSIRLEEFDTQPPSNVFDEQVTESTEKLNGQDDSVFTSSTMQRTLLKSLPARLEILRLVNSTRSELVYSKVLALSAEITSACININDQVKRRQWQETDGVSTNLLDYLVRRFYLPLHVPFATISQTNPMFYHSMKVCVDTATAIINPVENRAYSHLMVVGQGLFKESLKLATTAVGLELLVHVQSQYRDGTLASNPQYVTSLNATLGSMLTLATTSLRQSEMVLKDHMFISLILAHSEAISQDASIESQLAQKATASVESCYQLLRQRAAAANMAESTEPLAMTDYEDDSLGLGLDFFSVGQMETLTEWDIM